METVEVVTLKPHDYANKPRTIGERYPMEERFVGVMVRMGNVEVVQTEKTKGYKRRDMQAQKDPA